MKASLSQSGMREFVSDRFMIDLEWLVMSQFPSLLSVYELLITNSTSRKLMFAKSGSKFGCKIDFRSDGRAFWSK